MTPEEYDYIISLKIILQCGKIGCELVDEWTQAKLCLEGYGISRALSDVFVVKAYVEGVDTIVLKTKNALEAITKFRELQSGIKEQP
jgi:hypothetical protein